MKDQRSDKNVANLFSSEDLVKIISKSLSGRNLEKLMMANRSLKKHLEEEVKEDRICVEINQKNFEKYFQESPAAGSIIKFLIKPERKSLKLLNLNIDKIEKIINALEIENKKLLSDERPFVIREIGSLSEQLTEQFFPHFLSLLLKLPELNSLCFRGNEIGYKLSKDLADILKKNKTLNSLHLYQNQIKKEGAQEIAKALETNETLTSLDLFFNNIGIEGAQAIAKALEKNRSLIALNLGANEIVKEGAQAIAKVLEVNNKLAKLNLRMNQIGNRGAYSLAKALEVNQTLTILDLSDNRIGNKGAKTLAKSLEKNKTLTKLDLSDNLIENEGAKDLAQFLEKNQSLENLDLAFNEIGSDGVKAIAEALRFNTSLTKLDFAGNRIFDRNFKKQITLILQRNKEIAKLITEAPINYNKEELATAINFIVRQNEEVLNNDDKTDFKVLLIKLLNQQPNKEILLELFNKLSLILGLKEKTKDDFKALITEIELPKIKPQKDSVFEIKDSLQRSLEAGICSIKNGIEISNSPQLATSFTQELENAAVFLQMDLQSRSPSNSPNISSGSIRKFFSNLFGKCFGS